MDICVAHRRWENWLSSHRHWRKPPSFVTSWSLRWRRCEAPWIGQRAAELQLSLYRPTRPSLTQAFLASERPRRTPNIFKHPNGVAIVRRVCQQWQKTSETETYRNLKGMVGLAYVWQLRFDGCGSVSIPILRDYAPWIPADRMMWRGARHGISCDIPHGPSVRCRGFIPTILKSLPWRLSSC